MTAVTVYYDEVHEKFHLEEGIGPLLRAKGVTRCVVWRRAFVNKGILERVRLILDKVCEDFLIELIVEHVTARFLHGGALEKTSLVAWMENTKY